MHIGKRWRRPLGGVSYCRNASPPAALGDRLAIYSDKPDGMLVASYWRTELPGPAVSCGPTLTVLADVAGEHAGANENGSNCNANT